MLAILTVSVQLVLPKFDFLHASEQCGDGSNGEISRDLSFCSRIIIQPLSAGTWICVDKCHNNFSLS